MNLKFSLGVHLIHVYQMHLFYFPQGDEGEWAVLLAAVAACDAISRCSRVPLGSDASVAERAGERF